MKSLVTTFDAADAMTAFGLALMFYGLWEVYPPAAFVVVGAVLSVLGIAAAIRRG